MATHSVFLSEKSHDRKTLTSYSPWGLKELGMAEPLSTCAHNVVIFPEKNGMQINMKLCEDSTKSFLIKHIFYFILFFNFLFSIGVELIENIVTVSGVQQSDSVMHIRVSILFSFRLLPNSEQSSLCYTVGPCWLSVLRIAVCTCQPQSRNLFLPLVTVLFSKSMWLFLFWK